MESHFLVAPTTTTRPTAPFHIRLSYRRQLHILASCDEDHYAVLGLTPTASSSDIKRAYRLLALKHHPDVSKRTASAEVFKTILHSYQILSNEVTRAQYDRVLRLREDTGGRSSGSRLYHSPEFEDEVKFYKWAEVRRRMQRERYWERYCVSEDDDDTSSETEDEASQGSFYEERGPFIEVLRSAFTTIFLLHLFGPRLSLALSGLMALFDNELDAGYKIGHMIAWVLGGRGGILLTLCLQFASWACGKTSSSIVTLTVVAMWVGSHLASFAPLPQGALLALLYMSIKLQVDLN